MFVVEQDEGGGGDRADAPGAEADPAQRLEGGLEQGVAAFGRSSGGRVQQVDAALIRGQPPLGGALDRAGQRAAFAFVAQVGQGSVLGVGGPRSSTAVTRRIARQLTLNGTGVPSGPGVQQRPSSAPQAPCLK